MGSFSDQSAEESSRVYLLLNVLYYVRLRSVEFDLPRSGVDGPRFANNGWIPVKMEPRGSQPIT